MYVQWPDAIMCTDYMKVWPETIRSVWTAMVIWEETMRIIIIGCGKVGLSLAEQLNEEHHDLVIIDSSAESLQEVPENIDAMKIVGNGSSIQTLLEAGVDEADILIAVTESDELNLLCGLIA